MSTCPSPEYLESITITDLGAPIPASSRRFRICNKRLHLTYVTHLNPSEYIKFIIDILEKKYLDNTVSPKNVLLQYSVVLENSPEGYMHTHALLVFKNQFETENPRIFDFNEKHPHIVKVTTDKHYNNCVKYHKKSEVPYTNITQINGDTIVQAIWACETETEALMKCCHLKNPTASDILLVFSKKPKEDLNIKIPLQTELNEWQRELEGDLLKTPDDRTVLWYYDPNGSTGKTVFTKYMASNHKAFISTLMDQKDTADAFKKHQAINPANRIVIINIPKDLGDGKTKKIYEQIESFKDGLISAPKYNSSIIIVDPFHVVVFANKEPDIYSLSLDRWIVKTIKRVRYKIEGVKVSKVKVIKVAYFTSENSGDSSTEEEPAAVITHSTIPRTRPPLEDEVLPPHIF